MFRHMVEENNLEPLMVSYGLDMENDLTFIDELIKGVDTKEKDVQTPVNNNCRLLSPAYVNV